MMYVGFIIGFVIGCVIAFVLAKVTILCIIQLTRYIKYKISKENYIEKPKWIDSFEQMEM